MCFSCISTITLILDYKSHFLILLQFTHKHLFFIKCVLKLNRHEDGSLLGSGSFKQRGITRRCGSDSKWSNSLLVLITFNVLVAVLWSLGLLTNEITCESSLGPPKWGIWCNDWTSTLLSPAWDTAVFTTSFNPREIRNLILYAGHWWNKTYVQCNVETMK